MPTNPKVKAEARAVAPLAPQTEPPGSWQLNTAFGYMACDKSPAGRLVRLADVLRWIESTQSIPRVEALDVLCEAMPPEIMQGLHWVQPGNYSKPVPVDYGFGYKSATQIKKDVAQANHAAIQRALKTNQNTWGGFRSEFCFQSGRIAYKPPEPTEPGLPALLKALNRSWSSLKFNRAATVDILDDPRVSSLTQLAITLEKAAEIWGYGRVLATVDSTPQTFSELVTFRKANPGSPWFQNQRDILKTEVKSRTGQYGARAGIAAEFGFSVSRVGDLINEKFESKRVQPLQLKSVKR